MFVAAAAFYNPAAYGLGTVGQIATASLIEMGLGTAIGAITFTGSIVAFGKLQGIFRSAPITFPSQHPLNALLGVAELYDLIRARIADGLSVARLRFLIGSARRKRDCLDPDTRRFVVRTPVKSGPHSAASFGKDRITITGRGASAKSADGHPQAWFDPSKPVSLTFTAVDQPSVKHAGVLPLSHSVVLGEREFRFLVQAGRRGFVLVTAEDCAYP